MSALLQDLRYGVRMLTKNPGFTVVAVLTLALGIGANTAIFSVVNGVLLHPLPYPDSDRLVMLWETYVQKGWFQGSASLPNFTDWRERNQTFEEMAAFRTTGANLSGEDQPDRVTVADVTHRFFSILGVETALGRTFLPEEDQPGRAKVVVLSHGLWERRFGADPNTLGQKLMLNGEAATVVGVMPAAFDFPEDIDLWAPLALDSTQRGRRSQFLRVIARLKPALTLEQAQAQMDIIARQLGKEYPRTNRDWGINVLSLYDHTVGTMRPALLILLGAVGFVLLIACANVANLFLARATGREKEMAIRAALGAGRKRIIRQLLTESGVLAVLAGSLGVLLAFWGIDLLLALSPDNLPRMDEVGVDGRVLGFTLIVSLAAGVLFGLAPGLQASKTDLNVSLKEGGRTSDNSGGQHLRGLLMVSEVALGLVLLIGAGLLIKSFYRLQQVDPGFNPKNLLTLRFSLPRVNYPEEHQIVGFYRQLLERVETLSQVESTGAVHVVPLRGENQSIAIAEEGQPYLTSEGKFITGNYRRVSPNYHRTMEIPLIRGRLFTQQDNAHSSGVVIINETMARRYWPDDDPLGRRFRIATGDEILRTIVGVVGDVKHFGLNNETRPEMYVPHSQDSKYALSMALMVRTTRSPESVVAEVRHELQTLDSQLPIYNAESMEKIIFRSVGLHRFTMILVAVFAGAAFLLAAIGIYGVISYSVSQRSHEFGVRMALGAQRTDILKLMLKHGMRLALVGATVGLAGALALTRVMTSLLYEVSPADPTIFSLVASLIILVALLACYFPARRATKVDPMTALRYE
ncbi:ABC transporter permease [Acidobacteria bacterium AH-259-A15]|nr:ABC transporter permease [Acidobacteria bacterium AH-259-A15]